MDTPLSGILPLIYSAGNQAKRGIYGLLGDPMGFIGSLGQDLQTQQDERRKALATLLSPGVFTTPQEQNAAMGAMTQEAMNLLAPTVYHGSPHKFDRFDSSKIGTGEGAQAYGHGLYFAENPAVAKEYQQSLNEWYPTTGKTKPGTPEDAAAAHVASAIDGGFTNYYEKARDWIKRQGGPIVDAKLAVIDKWEKSGTKFEKGGAVYKVDLPDDMAAKMLDWDKPLSQQPESVRQALESAPGWPFVKQFIDRDFTRNVPAGVKPNGQALSEILSNRFGGQDKAAEYLQSIGIPGIRYLDAGSRGAGKGSYNYVVFPGGESQLKILERNGSKLQGLLGE